MEVYTTTTTNNLLEVKDGSVSRSSLYNVKFTSAASEYMDIIFPVSYNQGSSVVSLFDYKLQTTNTNGISYTITDVANALGAAVKYRLFFGVPALEVPARIRILFASVNAVNINVQALFNPSKLNYMTPISI